MRDFIEVIQEGLTLIYGPPGAGKTSLALKLADRLAKRAMWISTTESAKFLAQTAKRVGADPEKFAFLDFPRAFREDIIKYIMEHANEYDLIAVDSINGLSASIPALEKMVHSVLYQISQDKPVILISEEEPQKLHYIADHVIHVWYKKNSIGHIIRYAQLEKSRKLPPGPRYIFDIVEGTGIVYTYITSSSHTGTVVEDEKLGIVVPMKSEICIGSEKVNKVTEILKRIKDDAIFVQLGPWVAYRGLDLKENQEYVISTFHHLFKIRELLKKKVLTPRYIVISGLINLREEEIHDYLLIFCAFLEYVDHVIFVNVGPVEEIKRIERFCVESLIV